MFPPKQRPPKEKGCPLDKGEAILSNIVITLRITFFLNQKRKTERKTVTSLILDVCFISLFG
ncbi:MAG: hypothetical protein DRJ06_01040 [Candidatus Aminicenantes bacterium]|nr:MAG: hypothetical protein DRJ06_01040 [Candidatus Aminicenantes bacterium]